MKKIYFLFAATILFNTFSVSQPNFNYNDGKQPSVSDKNMSYDKEYLFIIQSDASQSTGSDLLSSTIIPDFIEFNNQPTNDLLERSQPVQLEHTKADKEPDKSETKPKKNSIYITLAPDFAFWAVGAYIERTLYTWNKGSLFARAGYQGWVILLAEGGDAIIFQPGILLGNNKNHFEAAAGVANLSNTDRSDRYYRPALSLGLRHQKPGKGFLFRTGIGYPDGIYVSIGTSF